MRTFGVLVSATVAITAMACGDRSLSNADTRDVTSVAADGPAGVYVLRTVAGQSLPAEIVKHDHYRALMVRDTIYLHADGTGAAAATKEVAESSPPGPRIVQEINDFKYTVSGTRLTAEMPCNDIIILATCLAAPHYAGEVSATGLVLDVAINYRAPLRYVRVGGPTNVMAVRISATDPSVDRGREITLSATGFDAAGNAVSGKVTSWFSWLPSVATVTATGIVHGVAEGVAPVRAFIDGRFATVVVRVRR